LKEERHLEYHIEKVIPYDCILGFEPKKSDRYEISGIALDRYGNHTNEIKSIEIKAPRGERGENKADVRGHFQSVMSQCFDVVEEIRSSTADLPPVRDYSYLEQMPESLTRNAILDLNTILRDQPVHDELVHEAVKFLGDNSFLLEESLRDGDDKENGVLFAAGLKGYFWIQGKKKGRYMSNVIVDTVEWNNIRCLALGWQNKAAKIQATYTLTEDGRDSTVLYQWAPTVNEDTLHYPWLLQPLNGSWILADIMYKFSGKPMPASWIRERNSDQSTLLRQRYYH